MSCKITVDNVLKAVTVLSKTNRKAAVELYDTIANKAMVGDYFNTNSNSTSLLGSEKADVAMTDSTVNYLNESMGKWVSSKWKAGSANDKFVAKLGSTVNGLQSVVTMFARTEDQKTYDSEYGVYRTKLVRTLDKNVQDAIAVVSADWLANTLDPMMAEHRSDDDVRALLKLEKKATVTPDMRKEVSEFDMFYVGAVNDLGGKIYKLLGLKAKPNSEHINNGNVEATMKTELGMLALKGMEQAGVITTDKETKYKIDKKERTAHTIKVTTRVNTKGGNDVTIAVNNKSMEGEAKGLERIHDTISGHKDKHGVFTSKSLAVPKREDIKNDGITGEMLDDVVSEDHKDAIEFQSGTEYKFREAYTNAVKALLATDRDEETGVSLLHRVMGYTHPTNVIGIRRDSVKGKNRQIKETIDYLTEAQQDIGDGGMYAKWKVITNNRFMIDSNKLNWQDKKLHRYSVYHTATEVPADGVKAKLFDLMLAQAFDMPVDKRTADRILHGKDGGIQKLKAELLKQRKRHVVEYSSAEEYAKSEEFAEDTVALVEYIVDKHNGMLGEPEHMLSGVTELLQYNAAMENEWSYKTTAMIETDAITSGYGIKNMQFPMLGISSVLKELEKVGVFNDKSKHSSYGERAQEDSTNDSYEEPAQDTADKMKETKVETNTSFLRLIDPKAKFDKDGLLKSFSRSLMKQPFMVLNYGSGISSIINAVAKEAVNNLYKLADEYHYSVKTDVGKKKDFDRRDEILKELTEISNYLNLDIQSGERPVRNLAGALMENPEGFELTDNEVKAITSKVLPGKKGEKLTFGNSLTYVFNSKYKHFIELVKTTNETMTMQFNVARVMLDRKIANRYEELLGKYGDASLVPPISSAEIKEMVQGMQDKFPVLESALLTADGKPAPILIAKKDKANYKGEGDVELLGNVSKDARIHEVNGMTSAATEVYKLVEAYSSGAVVPIHFFDGAVQARVLKTMKSLGVHDANYFTLDTVMEGTKLYNKEWLELNREYSLMGAMVDSFRGTFGEDTKELRDTLVEMMKDPKNSEYDKESNEIVTFMDDVVEQAAMLKNQAEAVAKRRKALFENSLKVEHAYFPAVDGESVTYVSEGKTIPDMSTDIGNGIESMIKDKFIEELAGIAVDAHDGTVVEVKNKGKATYYTIGDKAKVEVSVHDGITYVSSVGVKKGERGKGLASKLLEQVVNDYKGTELHLMADPEDSTTTIGKLVRLYEEYGFEINDERTVDQSTPYMIRPANKVKTGSNSARGTKDNGTMSVENKATSAVAENEQNELCD